MRSARRTLFRGLKIFILALVCGSVPCSFAAEKLPPIFDGKTFTGWRTNGGAIYTIEDGMIHAVTGDRKMGWLFTQKSYGDFVMELEIRIGSGNSGVQIRSHFDPEKTGDRMVGTQVEVDPLPRAWSGGLYDQGRRGWLQNLTNNPVARAAFKTNEWNKYRIECEGDSIKTWVNGVPVTDYLDAMDPEGFIALQLHNGTGADVRFRDVRLADRGRHEWKPLSAGTNYAGWVKTGRGQWQVEDGVIHATVGTGKTNYSLFVWDKTLSDFAIRLKYKTIKGALGVRFRMPGQWDNLKDGLGTEVNSTGPAGGLYVVDGPTWPSLASEDAEKHFAPVGWNTLTIYSHGPRVAINVNGYLTSEATNITSRVKGRFALELPAREDSDIYIKDIEILEKMK